MDPCQFIKEMVEAAVQAAHGQALEHPWHTDVKDGVVAACSLVAKGTPDPCLPGTGLACNDQILMGLQPVTLGELQDIAAIQTSPTGKVDIFDARIRKAQFGGAQTCSGAAPDAGERYGVQSDIGSGGSGTAMNGLGGRRSS